MDNSRIFNRRLLRLRRNRAATDWEQFDFLKKEAVARLVDNLADIKRVFPFVLDLGSHKGELAAHLVMGSTVVSCDIAERMKPHCVCDEELLPFAPEVFDLVTSALSLHHVNDLPGCLTQIERILKPDGLFMAILPGANTLIELRQSVIGAAAQHGFALSPRISPFVEVRDAGALLQRAGFTLPVVHSDTITIRYDSAHQLMRELQGMGESNVLLQQTPYFTARSHLEAIVAYYHAHFTGSDNSIPASVELVTMIGWKSHASQQQPAKRGSGKVNLNQVF